MKKRQSKNKKKFQLRLRRIYGGWAVMKLGLFRVAQVSLEDAVKNGKGSATKMRREFLP